MEKQKGGLHKQVAAIFEGLPGDGNHSSSSPGMPKQETVYKTSFPGNIAVMNNPQDSDVNNGASAEKPIVNNAPQKDAVSMLSKPLPVVQKIEIPKADKADSRDKQNRVMLPASLTAKPKVNIVDMMKIKAAALVEQHGKMHLISLIAMPFLAIIMVFALWNALKTPSNAAKTTADSAIAAKNAQSQLSLSWAKPTLFPENLRDPMRKYASASGIPSTQVRTDLVIRGISYMEANPADSTAIIGKSIVRIGDNVSGAIVKDIQRDHVIFEVDGALVTRGVGR